MLDLKQIRRDPEPVRAALARRRDGSEERLDRVLELDERTRALRPEVESLKAEQNAASKAIGAAKREGGDATAEIAAMQEVAQRVKTLSQELADADAELQAALSTLPNPPDPTAADEDTTLREEGVGRRRRPRPPRGGGAADRHGVGRAGVRLALRLPARRPRAGRDGALPLGARDSRARRASSRSCRRCSCARRRLYGTGFLPDTEQQIYRLADDDLYLVGTSEVPLASLHAGEILEAGSLPRRYAGISPCFRREAGAAGRDTRGILRVHQFDKVEMFSFVEPETAADEHELLLSLEERFLRELEIPYRVVNIGADDLGASASKKYDLEAWMPGQERYREVTSTSNTTDFQSRRLDIRYRDADGRPRHVFTLNGTAVTWRHMIALLENHQGEVPDVLRRWGAPERLRVGDA